MTRPFYDDIERIFDTRDTVKLPEVREIGMNEDDHINPRVSTTEDTENPENIFNTDNTHDEEKDTVGEENFAGGNTVTDHSKREADESVIDNENPELTS